MSWWHIIPCMTHQEIIRKLGGPTKVAREFGLEPVNTTVHWGTRGIPSKYWLRVLRMAEAHGVEIDHAHLEQSAQADA